MSLDNMFVALDKYEKYLRLYDYEGQINITGGEPLLHPDFFKIADEIIKRKIRLAVLTNGTLIDDKMADKIATLKLVLVQVSLDEQKMCMI